jgi:hypothetical protein
LWLIFPRPQAVRLELGDKYLRPFIGLELKMIPSYENYLRHQEQEERLYRKDWPEK